MGRLRDRDLSQKRADWDCVMAVRRGWVSWGAISRDRDRVLLYVLGIVRKISSQLFVIFYRLARVLVSIWH